MTKSTNLNTAAGTMILSLDGIRVVAIPPGFFAFSLVATS